MDLEIGTVHVIMTGRDLTTKIAGRREAVEISLAMNLLQTLCIQFHVSRKMRLVLSEMNWGFRGVRKPSACLIVCFFLPLVIIAVMLSYQYFKSKQDFFNVKNKTNKKPTSQTASCSQNKNINRD